MMNKNTNSQASIVLIRPPVLTLRRGFSYYGAIPPIGLAYIAAVLRDEGHEVTVIDAPGEAFDRHQEIQNQAGPFYLNGLSTDEIIERIPPDTEIIGITHMFLHEWPIVRKIAEMAKLKFPEASVILGGENATAFWEYILKESPAIDYCILGEGERKVIELVKHIKNGVSISGLAGVVNPKQIPADYGQKSGVSRILDLEKLPWPAWELFPLENYLKAKNRFGTHRGRSMPILATRGCLFRCTFCSSPQMWGSSYVTRKPQDVINEIKFYISKYKIENLDFCDLTAITGKKWIVEFCGLIKKENINISWQLPIGTRSEALDAEVLSMLYDAGCRNITYAPESGSERMLKELNKKVCLPLMLDSLKAAHKSLLITRVSIIIGHPQEQRRDIWKSLKLLIKSALAGCDDASIMMFAPYPGSEDFRKLLTQGKITVDNNYYYLSLARSGASCKTYNLDMGTGELIVKQFLMGAVFYFLSYLTHPRRIWDIIRSLISGREQRQVDHLLRTKLSQNERLSKLTSKFRSFPHPYPIRKG